MRQWLANNGHASYVLARYKCISAEIHTYSAVSTRTETAATRQRSSRSGKRMHAEWKPKRCQNDAETEALKFRQKQKHERSTNIQYEGLGSRTTIVLHTRKRQHFSLYCIIHSICGQSRNQGINL